MLLDERADGTVNEILRVLQALQSGGVCSLDWKSGESTLII